jgi:hypothetical protein
MLLSTLSDLDDLVDPASLGFIELSGFVADFMKLEDTLKILERAKTGIHRHGKRVAFFLPGNTLANFNPQDMFENVFRNSRAGDLFLVSAEVVVEGKEHAFAVAMEDRYRTRELANLVLPPIRPFLDAKKIDVMGDGLTQKIKSTRRDGYWSDLHVRDAFTIEIRVLDEAKDVDIVLATSSRYTYGALAGLSQFMGFDLIGDTVKVELPHHEHHQILMERKSSRQRLVTGEPSRVASA